MRLIAVGLLIAVVVWFSWPDSRDARSSPDRSSLPASEPTAMQAKPSASRATVEKTSPSVPDTPSGRSRAEFVFVSPAARRRACIVTLAIEARQDRTPEWLDETTAAAGLRWERRDGELRVLLREEPWEEPVERGYEPVALRRFIGGPVIEAMARQEEVVLGLFGGRAAIRHGPDLAVVRALPAIHREIEWKIQWAAERGPTLSAAREALDAGDRPRAARLAREVLTLDPHDIAARALLLRSEPSPSNPRPDERAGSPSVAIFAVADLAKRYRLDSGHDVLRDLKTVLAALGPMQVEVRGSSVVVAAAEAVLDRIRALLRDTRYESHREFAMLTRSLGERRTAPQRLLHYPAGD